MAILYYSTRTPKEMKVRVRWTVWIFLHILIKYFGPSMFLWCHQPINVVRIFLSCNSRMISQVTFTALWLAHRLFTWVPMNATSSLTDLPLRWMGTLMVNCLQLLYRHPFFSHIRSWMFGANFNPTLTDLLLLLLLVVQLVRQDMFVQLILEIFHCILHFSSELIKKVVFHSTFSV